MAPASNEEQFKFLISCIRYSNNGKVDFGQVAKECKIVSKGAAAKRYERMMRAHGIAPNAASIKPAPSRAVKSERRESGISSSKKRKADALFDDDANGDDDESFGNMNIKPDPANIIKQEHRGQLSISEAANLMQYYDNPSQYSGSQLGRDGSFGADYSGGIAGYATTAGPTYGMDVQQNDYFSAPYSPAGLDSISASENQSLQYQAMLQYPSDEPGRSDSPVIVE